MKVEDNVRYNTRGRKIVVRPHDEKVFAKDWQKEILKKHFELNPYPDRKEMQEIEKKVQLDFKWLKNWYHFQRKKGDIKKDSWIKSEKLEEDDAMSVTNDVIDKVDVIGRTEDDMRDDKTELLADLQRKFDELQARYNLMAGLLLEKSILKPDDVDKLHHQNEKISNPSPAEPEAASDQMTLTEAVETPTNNVPIKEESPAQASYVPAPYAPYPYHYPQYYPPPPQGYLPYPPPPQYYPQQPHQPSQFPPTQLQPPPQYPASQPSQYPPAPPSQYPPQQSAPPQSSQYPPQQAPPQYPPMMSPYPPQPQYQQQS